MADLKELLELSKNLSDEQLRFILLIKTSNFFTSPFVRDCRISKNFDIRNIVDDLVHYVKTGEKTEIKSFRSDFNFFLILKEMLNNK